MTAWLRLAARCASMGFFVLLAGPASAASAVVGVREIAAFSKERGQDLAVTVWYPAQLGGTAQSVGESVLFQGTKAMLEAPIAQAAYPLIVLSHGVGLGGSPQAMSWLATPLAEQGYIVAAPAHPGNGGAHRSAAQTIKLWLRPADISATLDALQQQPPFAKHLATGRVGVLGLSMGGGTALALAGMRIDPVRLAGFCDLATVHSSLCGWLRQSGVDLHAMDLRLAGRDNQDPRIQFAMAIDPAPLQVFERATAAEVAIPIEIMHLGRPDNSRSASLEQAIAQQIPNGRYSTITDASHYSLLGECKPGALEIAKSQEIDEPICQDAGGQTRAGIHQRLIAIVAQAFARALKTDP